MSVKNEPQNFIMGSPLHHTPREYFTTEGFSYSQYHLSPKLSLSSWTKAKTHYIGQSYIVTSRRITAENAVLMSEKVC